MMFRFGILMLLALFAVVPAAAQEVDETPVVEETGAVADEPGDAPADDDSEFDDADLDQQTYEEDDDVFVPTEEIPADEPIPFPTDI